MAVKDLHGRIKGELDSVDITDQLNDFTPPDPLQDVINVPSTRHNHFLLGKLRDTQYTLITNSSIQALGAIGRRELEIKRELVTQALDSGAVTTKTETYLVHGDRVDATPGGANNQNSEPATNTHVFRLVKGSKRIAGESAAEWELDLTTDPITFKRNGENVFTDF